MKYKVGDKVRVREDLAADNWYGNKIVVSGMTHLKGKIVTISKVLYDKYEIEEDNKIWWWSEEMFLHVTKYKIGDKVLVREDLEPYQRYREQSFVASMTPFKGKIVTIYDVVDGDYRIKEDNQNWWWTDEMFSGKVSEDFSPEEFILQNTIPEEENSSNIITVKTTKLKLLLL